MRRATSSCSCFVDRLGGADAIGIVDRHRHFGIVAAGRLPEPEKITASMSAARMDLYEFSPITQRSASTRLDLPQPFGPTTPVRPGSIRKSVGSTKDLNPISRSRVSFMLSLLPLPAPPSTGSLAPLRRRGLQESLNALDEAGEWRALYAGARRKAGFPKALYKDAGNSPSIPKSGMHRNLPLPVSSPRSPDKDATDVSS